MAVVGWISAAPAILVALVLLLGPGLAGPRALTHGLLARVALAGPISIVSIGAAGVVFAPFGLAFAVWQPAVLSLGRGPCSCCFCDAGWHRPLRSPWRCGRSSSPGVASAFVIGRVAFAAVPSGTGQPDVRQRVPPVGDRIDPRAWRRVLAEPSHSHRAGPHLRVLSGRLAFARRPRRPDERCGDPGRRRTRRGSRSAAVVWLPGAAWLAQVCLPRTAPTTVPSSRFPSVRLRSDAVRASDLGDALPDVPGYRPSACRRRRSRAGVARLARRATGAPRTGARNRSGGNGADGGGGRDRPAASARDVGADPRCPCRRSRDGSSAPRLGGRRQGASARRRSARRGSSAV